EAEQGEGAGADLGPLDTLEVVSVTDVHRSTGYQGRPFEYAGIRCPVHETRRVDVNLPLGGVTEVLDNRAEVLRLGERQRPIEQRVQDAEDRSVRADADSQRDQRDRRKAWTLCQCSQRVTQILEERFHKRELGSKSWGA